MGEIQRADSRARQIAIWALVVLAIVGATVLLLIDHYREPLLAWALADSFRARAGVLVLVALASAPLPVVAVYAVRIGSRVIRENRHPPAGTRVIRDTPVVFGAAARRRGRAYQVLATILFLSFGGALWILWRLWYLM
jgi:hypothetical protein